MNPARNDRLAWLRRLDAEVRAGAFGARERDEITRILAHLPLLSRTERRALRRLCRALAHPAHWTPR